jgi:hypothetical protein
MSSKPNSRSARWLLIAGLLAGFAAAHAAGGCTVKPNEENMVHVRMDPDLVMQALGHPTFVARHGYQWGPTWTYEVVHGNSQVIALFDVNFDALGTVASVDERIK